MTLMKRGFGEIEQANGSGGGGVAGEVIAAGGAMQQVKTSYSTAVAVQRPRVLKDVARRLFEEADLAGEDFYYGWGAGNDKIEGPSVDLALAAARCYGNCVVEMLPMADTYDAWVFTAAFVDLETGFTLHRQFRQSKKWQVFGKFDEARKDDIRFQIGQSKAIRNVVLNALPSSLISKAIEHAKDGVKRAIEDYVKKNGLAAAVDAIFKALAKVGVTEDRVLAKAGVADRKALDVDMIVMLRGDLTAIESGRDWADEVFPPPKGPSAEAGELNARAAAKQGAPSTGQPAGAAPPPAPVPQQQGGTTPPPPTSGAGTAPVDPIPYQTILAVLTERKPPELSDGDLATGLARYLRKQFKGNEARGLTTQAMWAKLSPEFQYGVRDAVDTDQFPWSELL